MIHPKRSSRARNGRAAASLLIGLLAVAALPTAIGLSEYADRYDLVGRVGGEGTARVGRTLGVLGIMLGLSGAIAIGVYLVLTRFFE